MEYKTTWTRWKCEGEIKNTEQLKELSGLILYLLIYLAYKSSVLKGEIRDVDGEGQKGQKNPG